ncbi:hypothetical protein DYBT9275_00537 [Dyadobacter sp. CECT 9275]|uniref:ATP-grasp fold RimK-type domain-containing protein n=1 Tax=Dyadobacter helix TaxID=2822344 RepID=A0A916J8N6_9BACT|nr:hypothetical protein [Dyadobacter sp. CECT 9275]CAG4990479.1 hypothetical protein DYBT9275_00537 [Dyadobacter sp. CECT 9275]
MCETKSLSQRGSLHKNAGATQFCVRTSQVPGLKFQDGNSYVVEVNGNPGSKIIDITGYNYFHDLVKHIEKKTGFSRKEDKKEEGKKEKDDSNSPRAQLASLESRQERGERMSINEVAMMGLLRKLVKVA